MTSRLPMSFGPQRLEGELCLVDPLHGIVVFALGGEASPHNGRLAEALQHQGLGTLQFGTRALEEACPADACDVPWLAQRMMDAIDELSSLLSLPIGLFGAGAETATALVAAAQRPRLVHAVVSCEGRLDLREAPLEEVGAPTLLIVGGADAEVLALNRAAFDRLRGDKRLKIIPDATHLLEEAATLDTVASLAGTWFLAHLRPPPGRRRSRR